MGMLVDLQSWREMKIKQQPEWPDDNKVKEAAEELSRMPPLVFAGECRNLQARLAKCATGESFWLQGASCFRRPERLPILGFFLLL